MKATFLKKLAVSCLLATFTFVGGAFASMSGTQFGKLEIAQTGMVPNRTDVSFVAFINGSDDVIHTENAYNSPLGLNQGYVVRENQGFWLVNFANFADAQPGDTFQVQFTTKTNERAEIAGTVPAGLTQTSNAVELQASTAPLAPTNLRAQRTGNGTLVSWDADAGLTYRVYRADLPSGADNGHSRGIYNKVAEGVRGGSFVDSNVLEGKNYWYLVIAENKNGVLSGHSGEVRALKGSQFANKPQVKQPAKIQQKNENRISAPSSFNRD